MTAIEYPRFIDFEASGLSEESYPIEVAWNNADGTVESYLINTDCVADWTYWDPHAEADAHKISQDHLERLGDPPSVIAQRMNEALTGQVLYSDHTGFDGFWLQRLFDAVNMTPAFKLGSAVNLFDLSVDDSEKQSGNSEHDKQVRFDIIIDTYGKTAWDNIGLRPHRAGNDVKHLMETYRLLLESGGHVLQA